MTQKIDPSLWRIDPREVYGNEDTFVDSDEWLAMREREWISRIVLDPADFSETISGSRRKEK